MGLSLNLALPVVMLTPCRIEARMQNFVLVCERKDALEFMALGLPIMLETFNVQAKDVRRAKLLAPSGQRLVAVERGGVELFSDYRYQQSYGRVYKNGQQA
jgi:hypothetical protein